MSSLLNSPNLDVQPFFVILPYISHNLDVQTFLWSAGGTFNVVFAIGTTLPTSTFRHFCGRPRLMSSLLGLPNSIQQFKCHTTLYMLSVLSSRLFIIFYVTNVVFARSASADQRLEISGRFFQLSSVCAGAPLRSGHFCGRPVVHLMSSLPLVQLSQPRRSDISVVGRV